MQVLKEHVIEALETEPLGWNGWCQSMEGTGSPAKDLDCTVCAVGAVFRKFTSRHPDAITTVINARISGNYAAFGSDTKDDLPKNWITCLSYVWEGLGNFNPYIDVEEARVHMIDWAEENIPDDEVLWVMC